MTNRDHHLKRCEPAGPGIGFQMVPCPDLGRRACGTVRHVITESVTVGRGPGPSVPRRRCASASGRPGPGPSSWAG